MAFAIADRAEELLWQMLGPEDLFRILRKRPVEPEPDNLMLDEWVIKQGACA